ncbi:hypothetical protein N657DRAFT_635576 [Parathielavia appendiculata]|uniref:Uncharacterized protein n=1 Tax=Parathielavia appendiculata TaxID=2587402 RepID=A0AAN6TVI7_9PEZI|nr:hypothetical protein N657DRAFT_635576 [Parathielavia appendiculata]
MALILTLLAAIPILAVGILLKQAVFTLSVLRANKKDREKARAMSSSMGLSTILCGFRVSVAVLDRFFEANGVMPTFGPALGIHPHQTGRHPGGRRRHPQPKYAQLHPQQRGKPHGDARLRPYAYVMVFCQRQIYVARELPDQTPPGFAELRSEILGFANEDEEGLLRVADVQPAGTGEGQVRRACCLSSSRTSAGIHRRVLFCAR